MIGLSFTGKNMTWESIHMLLDVSIEAEVAAVLSKENKGEDRAWYAGRADALSTFKTILIQTHKEITEANGANPNEQSKNGTGFSVD